MTDPQDIVDSLSDADADVDINHFLTGFKPKALRRRDSKYAAGYIEFNGKLGYGNGITSDVYVFRIVSPRFKKLGVGRTVWPLKSMCERWAEHGMARRGPAKHGARGLKSGQLGIGYYPP